MVSSAFHRRWALIGIAALVTLIGCSQPGLKHVDATPPDAYSFEIPTDYETVCDRIWQRADKRYFLTTDNTMRGMISIAHLPTAQTAVITVRYPKQELDEYRIKAGIRAIDSATTLVEISYVNSDDGDEARQWELWANTPLEDTDTSPQTFAYGVQHPLGACVKISCRLRVTADKADSVTPAPGRGPGNIEASWIPACAGMTVLAEAGDVDYTRTHGHKV